jgi:hypothetical protein
MFKSAFRIPLFPKSFITSSLFKNGFYNINTNYKLFKYDMEYIHGETVSSGALLGDINICPNFIPNYNIYKSGKLILSRNIGINQPGLIFFGNHDYQIVFGISKKFSLEEIEKLTLGWIEPL